MTKARSAIVVGGGHNGLICAAYLARKGLKVEVLEARNTLGGGLALTSSHMSLHASILKDLKIKLRSQAPVKTIALGPGGEHLRFSGNTIDGPDAASYAAFREEYLAYAKALGPLMLNTPPRLKDFDRADAMTFGKLGWALRFGLGEEAMREFLRVAGMNVYDVLAERFSAPLLKGALAYDAIIGCHVGPRTPNTVLNCLMRLFHDSGQQRVSAEGTASALEEAAGKAGVTMKCGAKVASILVEGDKAVGVTLDTGEALRADIIVSNADAKTTFLDLLGTRHLDALFTHRINKTRTDGDVARLRLTLKDRPTIPGLPDSDLSQRLVIAPDMRTVERAFNASKYGEYSKEPVMDMMLDGRTLSINAAYAPLKLKEGWEAGAEGFKAAVLTVLERYAPGLSASVETAELMTPADMAEAFGNAGGHWHHGEMAIDQAFMMRPVHGTAQYETPVTGLYLCGAAAHPGGDITGLPGRNAAKRILRTA
ncbi:MAG: NAD(P)/FAD-dependent oxidoreductase [Pseudomonadota bacterium]